MGDIPPKIARKNDIKKSNEEREHTTGKPQ